MIKILIGIELNAAGPQVRRIVPGAENCRFEGFATAKEGGWKEGGRRMEGRIPAIEERAYLSDVHSS